MAILSFREAASRRVWALFCLSLFFALQLVTSSSALHKLIHADADSADHHCAVTEFSRGQVNYVDVFVPVAALVAVLIFFLPVLTSAEFSSFAYRYSACRAPPLR